MKMDNAKIKKILDNYAKGRASEADRERLINWYKSVSDHKANSFLDHLGDLVDSMGEEELNKLEERLLAVEKNTAKTKSIQRNTYMMRFAKIAAVLVVFLVAIFLVFINTKRECVDTIEYRAMVGEIKEVVLPDKSTVILNSMSVLQVPTEFDPDRRTVKLSGEAFFEIKRDKSRPFLVETVNGLEVLVLGTSFNVKDYNNCSKAKVAVATGKVSVGKDGQSFMRITKGQQVSYGKKSGKFAFSEVREVKSWVEGKFIFSENSLYEVANVLNRSFKQQVDISHSVDKGLLIKGTFNKEQGLEEIVEILCSLHGLTYKTVDNKIFIRNQIEK